MFLGNWGFIPDDDYSVTALAAVLHFIAVYCSVLQCIAVWRLLRDSVCGCVAVRCSVVLQCVAVYSSVLQCIAVYCRVTTTRWRCLQVGLQHPCAVFPALTRTHTFTSHVSQWGSSQKCVWLVHINTHAYIHYYSVRASAAVFVTPPSPYFLHSNTFMSHVTVCHSELHCAAVSCSASCHRNACACPFHIHTNTYYYSKRAFVAVFTAPLRHIFKTHFGKHTHSAHICERVHSHTCTAHRNTLQPPTHIYRVHTLTRSLSRGGRIQKCNHKYTILYMCSLFDYSFRRDKWASAVDVPYTARPNVDATYTFMFAEICMNATQCSILQHTMTILARM